MFSVHPNGGEEFKNPNAYKISSDHPEQEGGTQRYLIFPTWSAIHMPPFMPTPGGVDNLLLKWLPAHQLAAVGGSVERTGYLKS